MKRLDGKISIITGAANGIGAAAAKLFAKEGALVIIVDIDEVKGNEVVFNITQEHGEAFFIKVDMKDPKAIQEMIKNTIKDFNRVDILYNNAGVEYPKLIEETSLEEWEETININLRSTFLSCKYVIPQMVSFGGGVIINTGSVASLVGTPLRPAYDASKGGILQLTRNIALDYGRHNIRANCICPGIIKTNMVAKSISSSEDPETVQRQCEESQPLGRLGLAEEVAHVALFLASDESSYITGTTLIVDGGLTACWQLPSLYSNHL